MIDLDKISYQDFVAKLAKSGELMDKEISDKELELLTRVFLIKSECNNLGDIAFFELDEDRILRKDRLRIVHMAIGMCGESGELINPIKNIIIYRKATGSLSDKDSIAYNVLEEIGDLMFYHTEYNNCMIEFKFRVNSVLISKIESFLSLWNQMYPSERISIEMAIDFNKQKLSKRYKDLEYTDKKAVERADKVISFSNPTQETNQLDQ